MKRHAKTAPVSSRAPHYTGYAVLIALLIFQILWLRWLGVLAISYMRVAGVDPVGYYVYLPSLIFDRDLDFADEYKRFDSIGYVSPDQTRTVTGKMPNPYSIGVAVLWLPFFLVGHLVALATGLPADGFSRPYDVAVYLANTVYGLAGILLIYRLVEREFERNIALLATTLVWFASNVLYYLFPIVPMSHMPSMFVVALLITMWLVWREKMTVWRYVALGALGGLAALVRWQDSLFLVIPAADIVAKACRHRVERAQLRKTALHALALGLPFLVVFFPQMVVWKVLYGSFITIPQGPGFVSWFKIALFDVLFSSRHGLFSWTPILVFGVIGLFMFPKKKRHIGYVLAIAFVLQLYVNSVAGWVGWSFGMRRFINCSALFGLGLAAFLNRIHRRIPLRYCTLISLLPILWNMLFVIQYYAGLIPRDDYLTFDQFVTDKFRLLVSLLGIAW